jgi:hypothetical protein
MHALAHPLGARFGVHHGLLNAVLAPYVLIANRPAIEADAAWLAGALGLDASHAALVAWVVDLRREIAIPPTLADVGVPKDAAAEIARMAVEDPSAATNPIPFTQGAYARLFVHAWRGDLSHPSQSHPS